MPAALPRQEVHHRTLAKQRSASRRVLRDQAWVGYPPSRLDVPRHELGDDAHAHAALRADALARCPRRSGAWMRAPAVADLASKPVHLETSRPGCRIRRSRFVVKSEAA